MVLKGRGGTEDGPQHLWGAPSRVLGWPLKGLSKITRGANVARLLMLAGLLATTAITPKVPLAFFWAAWTVRDSGPPGLCRKVRML